MCESELGRLGQFHIFLRISVEHLLKMNSNANLILIFNKHLIRQNLKFQSTLPWSIPYSKRSLWIFRQKGTDESSFNVAATVGLNILHFQYTERNLQVLFPHYSKSLFSRNSLNCCWRETESVTLTANWSAANELLFS